ncbi:molybdopterin-dependent oxidoreductase [Notoacmeibacter ruber]|uniref:Oxidoreductase n=1 Tax=Notoacmeibacter ruber TaxID=2670375 RepID=A0A3L7JDK6_9HYPH|nr:molybdopterin-dependent oxidoreductase [Notoacmeibacter ruber]RLQ88868.1 oxidoreductase [Notoacmeibacter ruber]
MNRPTISLRIAGTLAFLFFAPMAYAGDLGQPQNEPVLTVTGSIGNTNEGELAAFDMQMLKELPATTFETTTIWTTGKSRFTGVAIDDLFEALDAKGDTINAIALNDYAVELPVSDAVEGGPIIAYELDGKPMSVRDKGPLWIVYPYDSNADYRTEQVYSRSVWQLNRLEVE